MPKTRWTLVTGASSGIGAELARVFAARGHHLVLTARRRDKLEMLARELERAHRGRVEVVTADLGDPAGPDTLMREVESRGVELSNLVNNAGFGLRGPFAEQPMDELMGMVSLNITALTRLSRMALPAMIARGEGGILNVASTAAYQAGPNMALYYATKAFVLSLSEALHEEAKPHGVRVTALCPGPTHSEFASRARMEDSRLFRSAAMSARDVAEAGVDGFTAGHAVVLPGASNAIGANLARILPRSLTRKLAGRLQA
ncbi:SDR family NAD(P)-dependent oxidoreductase [Salinarimonas soli]|uniref:SDR family oxidoreductase n=1 Tax=Salinarimonas soli TaxID=1638099 RepID=A0A5B2VBU1_9HYPH|nr:SDR family oxidoreductase [Salinarimonas soli]KAA2236206.1 SDR family oxidoreductase [Salinarimonas soli]